MYTVEQVVGLINPQSAKFLKQQLTTVQRQRILSKKDVSDIKFVIDEALSGDLRSAVSAFSMLETHPREVTFSILRRFHGI